MELLIEGHKFGHIAKQLKLDPKTVSTYYARMKTKIGLENSANLYLTIKTYLQNYGK